MQLSFSLHTKHQGPRRNSDYLIVFSAVALAILWAFESPIFNFPFPQLGNFFFFFFLVFLGPCSRHMEIPRLGVESDLQLPAYTTATAMLDP